MVGESGEDMRNAKGRSLLAGDGLETRNYSERANLMNRLQAGSCLSPIPATPEMDGRHRASRETTSSPPRGSNTMANARHARTVLRDKGSKRYKEKARGDLHRIARGGHRSHAPNRAPGRALRARTSFSIS